MGCKCSKEDTKEIYADELIDNFENYFEVIKPYDNSISPTKKGALKDPRDSNKEYIEPKHSIKNVKFEESKEIERIINNKESTDNQLDKYKENNQYSSYLSNSIFSDPLLEIKITYSDTKHSQFASLKPDYFLQTVNARYFIGGSNEIIKNDLNLNDTNILSKQLYIKYEKDTKQYCLVENKQTTGIFIKIKNKISVDKNMVIYFSPFQLLVSSEIDNDNSIFSSNYNSSIERSGLYRKLKIKFLNFDKNKLHKDVSHEYTYSSKSNNHVTIGRARKCNICFPKNDRISRIQCAFQYEGNEWVLYDGDLLEDGSRTSTNGIWRLATEKTTIFNGMEVKISNTTLEFYLK